MSIIIILLSIYGFLESIAYGLYEFHENENKIGALVVFIVATFRIATTYFWAFCVAFKYTPIYKQ